MMIIELNSDMFFQLFNSFIFGDMIVVLLIVLILRIDTESTERIVTIKWMPYNPIGDKSSLIHLMA